MLFGSLCCSLVLLLFLQFTAAEVVKSVPDLRDKITACRSACTFQIRADLKWDGREIELTQPDLSITLEGPPPSANADRLVTLDAGGRSRFFSGYYKSNLHFRIANLRLVNGNVNQPQAYGGAIYIKGGNGARVEVINSTFAYNNVKGSLRGQGGAVHVGGDDSLLSAENSLFMSNNVHVSSSSATFSFRRPASSSSTAMVPMPAAQQQFVNASEDEDTEDEAFYCHWNSCDLRNPYCSQSEEICETECSGTFGRLQCSSGADGAANGGALSVYGKNARVVLAGCRLVANSAVAKVTGTAHARGGAVVVMGTGSGAAVDRTVYNRNRAVASGEIVHELGGAMFVELHTRYLYSTSIHQYNFSTSADTVVALSSSGTIGGNDGAGVAYSCDAAYYNRQGRGGEQACAACPGGQFLNSSAIAVKAGAVFGVVPNACKTCPNGRYGDASVPGADLEAYCRTCPTGKYSNAVDGRRSGGPLRSRRRLMASFALASNFSGNSSGSGGTGSINVSSTPTAAPTAAPTSAPTDAPSPMPPVSCKSCAAGWYAPSPLPASDDDRSGGGGGEYSTGAGASSCRMCAAGSFSPAAEATSCALCGRGRFGASGATGCAACPAGRYGAEVGGSNATCTGPCPKLYRGRQSPGVDVGADAGAEAEAGGTASCPAGTGLARGEVVESGYRYRLDESGMLYVVSLPPADDDPASGSGGIGSVSVGGAGSSGGSKERTILVAVLIVGALVLVVVVAVAYRQAVRSGGCGGSAVSDNGKCHSSGNGMGMDLEVGDGNDTGTDAGKRRSLLGGLLRRLSLRSSILSLGSASRTRAASRAGSDSADCAVDKQPRRGGRRSNPAAGVMGLVGVMRGSGSRNSNSSGSRRSSGSNGSPDRRSPIEQLAKDTGFADIGAYSLQGDAAAQLRLKYVIGTGASGCVHAAEYYGQEVAVKELMLGPLSAEEKRVVFQQAAAEVRLLSRLHHPAIVRLVGTAVSGEGRLLIVTERCDMDLKEFLQSQPQCVGARDFETWHSLMRQIAGGMAFLHDNRIIHRDLKPGNVLVNLADQVRICDFGLSVRSRLKEREETHTGFAGTPLYMAPEVMGSEGVRYNGKVDVFAFGVLMNQCWTGRRPYDEVHGAVWKVQRHILDGGRPLWHEPSPQQQPASAAAMVGEEGEGGEDSHWGYSGYSAAGEGGVATVAGATSGVTSLQPNPALAAGLGLEQPLSTSALKSALALARATGSGGDGGARAALGRSSSLTASRQPALHTALAIGLSEISTDHSSSGTCDNGSSSSSSGGGGVGANDDGSGRDSDASNISSGSEQLQDLEMAVIALTSRCWATDPNLRPTFHEITKLLGEIDTNHVDDGATMADTQDP